MAARLTSRKKPKKKQAVRTKRAGHTRVVKGRMPPPRPPVRSAQDAAPATSSATGAADSTWNRATGEVGIRIRMYRVGFGDFFLLSFLGIGGTPVHAVIDCGVFKGTSQTGDIGTIEAAVANMAQVTAGHVALIVMTHRHADHIAGFARCASTFKQLRVESVWMPAWESEYSPVAVKFQAELTRTAKVLRQHFASLGASASSESQTARKYMENATGEGGKGSNAAALSLLKNGFSGVTPSYYQAGSVPVIPKVLGDAGLKARILGPPPVSDLAMMKLMDLQKGVGQYLAATAPGDSANTAVLAPFGQKWEVEPFAGKPTDSEMSDTTTQLATEAVREFVGPVRKSWGSVSGQQATQACGRLEKIIQQSQPAAALTAAKQLNSFLNNQSLVILFEFAGKQLLFVGDAQAGNWEHWLFDTDTPDKKGNTAVISDAASILASVNFYKVGHHGSGNATPKAAVEAMLGHAHPFAAMCSTEADVYGTEDPDDPTKGTEVPRIPLMQKLASESALVRSDQLEVRLGGKTIKPANDGKIPSGGAGFRYETGPLWIDCYL
jgi:hypothetical protein